MSVISNLQISGASAASFAQGPPTQYLPVPLQHQQHQYSPHLPAAPLTPTPSPSYNMQNFEAPAYPNGPSNPLLQRVNDFLNSIGGRRHLGSQYADDRFEAVETAVREGDELFLILHQIFCLSSINPQAIPRSVSENPNYTATMRYLTLLLTSNEGLRKDLLKWFSEFPEPLPNFVMNSPRAMQLLHAVNVTMYGIQNNHTLLNLVAKRGYPPLAQELNSMLGIRSHHLMKLVFTSVYRQIWGFPNAHNIDIHEAISSVFEQDIRNLTDSLANPGAPPAPSNYQRTIDQFKTLTGDLIKRNSEFRGPQAPHHSVSQSQTPVRQLAPQSVPISHHPGITGGSQQPATLGSPSHAPQFAPVQQQQMYVPRSIGEHIQLQRAQQAPNHAVPLGTMQQNGQYPVAMSPTNGRFALPSAPPILQGQPFGHVSPVPSFHSPVQQGQAFGHASPVPNSFQQFQSPRIIPPGLPNQTICSDLRTPSVPAAMASPIASATPATAPLKATPQTLYPSRYTPSLALPVNPIPEAALHQAHLRSPILKDPAKLMESSPGGQLYQYVGSFAFPPRRLKRSILQNFQFKIDRTAFDRIPAPRDLENGSVPVLDLQAGQQRYRIRACNRPGDSELTTAEWTAAETSWPTNAYLRLNGEPLEMRRKHHYAKDLPIHVTDRLRVGNNLLVASFNSTNSDPTITNWVFAVEIIDVKTQEVIKSEVLSRVRPASDVHAALLARLNGKTSADAQEEDDDIVITSSQLNISLFDPISASKIFDVPVRGSDCAHFECFDLDTFLLSRARKQPDWASEIDVWKCPICRGDARPQSLVVDGWMVEVRRELEGIGRLNTRTITVKTDGSWVGIEEKDVEVEKENEVKTGVGMDEKSDFFALKDSVAVRTSAVIDLSDSE